MALKQHREAARTAIIIAREDQCSGESVGSDVTASPTPHPISSQGAIIYRGLYSERHVSLLLMIVRFHFEFGVAFVNRLGLGPYV